MTVSIDQFSNHGDSKLEEVRSGSILLRLTRFQLALDTAEQVDLPCHIQSSVVTLDIHPVLSLTRSLSFTELTAYTAGDYELGKRMPDPELVERLAAELDLPAAYFYSVDDAEADLLVRYFRLSDESIEKLPKYLADLT